MSRGGWAGGVEGEKLPRLEVNVGFDMMIVVAWDGFVLLEYGWVRFEGEFWIVLVVKGRGKDLGLM